MVSCIVARLVAEMGVLHVLPEPLPDPDAESDADVSVEADPEPDPDPDPDAEETPPIVNGGLLAVLVPSSS